MKVENMQSAKGNFVPNQFIIYDNDSEYFQSYDSIIAKKSGGRVHLDFQYWDYSRTTGKYRNLFLGETTKETRMKIKTGEYILDKLN